MKWSFGRQNTGYRKLTFFQFPCLDMHLLLYPKGTSIPKHVDKIEGKRHVRLNMTIYGEDAFKGTSLLRTKRINLFFSDLPHEVTKVTKERLVLSIGMAI